MQSTSKSIVCIARDEVKAARLLDDLVSAGVSQTRISLLVPEAAVTGGFGPGAEPHVQGRPAGWGQLMGGTLNQLSNVGILTRPSFGRLIGAGPLMTAIHARSSQDSADICQSDLEQGGLSQLMAGHYERCLRHGTVLLAVHSLNAEEVRRVEGLLAQGGAQDIAQYEQESAVFISHDREAA